MDSFWNFLGGSIGFLSILFGFIFFAFIGFVSFLEVFQKSIWNNFKQIIYEKISSIVVMLFSTYMVYIMGRLLFEFFTSEPYPI